jgi:DNA-directed RNA polymerase specialized sigma24 family protein
MSIPSDELELLSTRSLIAEARAGNGKAVDLLGRRYVAAFQRWARIRLCPEGPDAPDTDALVRDALRRALRRPDARDALRTGHLLGHLRQGILDEARVVLSPPGSETSPSRSPIEKRVGAETLARFERGLAGLAPPDREAAIARIELELDYPQIAELLGEPGPDAARATVSRALARLAREVAGPGGS